MLDADQASWLDLARQAHHGEIDALAHRRYPLSQMLWDAGRDELFGTLVDYRNMRTYGDLSYQRLAVEDSDFFEQTNFPFAANYGADLATGEIRLRINYDQAEFSSARIETIGEYYVAAFAAMVADPAAPVLDATLLPAAEVDRQQGVERHGGRPAAGQDPAGTAGRT